MKSVVAVMEALHNPANRQLAAMVDGDQANMHQQMTMLHATVPELVRAHAAAHKDPHGLKRLGRLVLANRNVSLHMFYTPTPPKSGTYALDRSHNRDAFSLYKHELFKCLVHLGAPLREAYVRERQREVLGDLTLPPPHTLVKADQQRCLESGREHKLRSDIEGIVPLPVAWSFGEPVVRQRQERIFTHMLKLIAIALNPKFHEMMREVLEPFVVGGEGVMERFKDGRWRLTPAKGVARMECKRTTDHVCAPGCRPALNIDVLRVIGVCKTPAQLMKALNALGSRFGGCGRVKNNFSIEDAEFMFNLRTLLANFIVDFKCTYRQLAAEPGVRETWEQHAERSAPEGQVPRCRWRAEARAALSILTGAEFADKPVRFICEAQMLLDDVYQVRKHMHELYKGYRADTPTALYEDFAGEGDKFNKELVFLRNGGVSHTRTEPHAPLMKACRDGQGQRAAQLLAAGATSAQRDEAFIVACQNGSVDCVALPGFAGSAARTWSEAWAMASSKNHTLEIDERLASALLAEVGQVRGGIDAPKQPRERGPGFTAMREAAEGGHCNAVRLLLAAGAAVDVPTRSGHTALHVAAAWGHTSTVKLLLDHGACVDVQCRNDGHTAMFNAAQNGHDDVIALLLAHGADALHEKLGGLTALQQAAERGHDAAVALLIAAGTDVNKVGDAAAQEFFVEAGRMTPPAGKGATTPLLAAVSAGHVAVVTRLLENGADPNLDMPTSTHRCTPLIQAVENCNEGIVRTLLAHGAEVHLHSILFCKHRLEDVAKADVEAKAAILAILESAPLEQRALPVGAAVVLHGLKSKPALNGMRGTVQPVLAHTPERYAVRCADGGQRALKKENLRLVTPEDGEAPMAAAAAPSTPVKGALLNAVGNDAAVERLLNEGAEVDEVRKLDWCRPLHMAARMGRAATVRLLLARGADPNLTTKQGFTPLFPASEFGHDSIVQLLLDHGADVHHAGTRGDTALYMAAQEGREGAVRLLLGKAADANAPTDTGCTPLYIAAAAGREAVVRILLQAGADVRKAKTATSAAPLHVAAMAGHAAVVALLLDAHAPMEQLAGAGAQLETPLFSAVCRGHAAVVTKLLEAGASTRAPTPDKPEPLFMATAQGNEAVVAGLLRAGASVDCTFNDGSGAATPLIIAAQNGHDAVVARLLAGGAAVDLANDGGATPLLMAAQDGHDAVVARLLAAGAAVDLAKKNGVTPLCTAAQFGHTAAVQQLLAAGAALAPGGIYWSPLRLAEYGKHDAVVALLRARAQ